MDVNSMKRQLREAIVAGERALHVLGEAESKLGSARNWGLFDILGGDFIATLVKRSRMKEARELLEEASRELRTFQRELRDVQITTSVGLEESGLLAFADYVFDDLFSDILVQRKIGKARDSLRDAKRQVSSIVAALKEKYQSL